MMTQAEVERSIRKCRDATPPADFKVVHVAGDLLDVLVALKSPLPTRVFSENGGVSLLIGETVVEVLSNGRIAVG